MSFKNYSYIAALYILCVTLCTLS